MINIKTQKEIEIMGEGGKILANILKGLSKAVKPGITTQSLNKLADELVVKYGAKPAFLDYNNFPATLCTSINNEIVHGVPSVRKLKEGDVLKLDMGVLYKGFYTDSAITVLVSSLSGIKLGLKKEYSKKMKLISVTRKALDIGISKAKIGRTTGDIGSAIQKYVEGEGFNLVRELIGHGVGRELHEPPQVPNYGQPGEGDLLEPGMVIAIEPMVVAGGMAIEEGPDGFVYQTKDGSLAAHFEHTVAITEKGPKILTML